MRKIDKTCDLSTVYKAWEEDIEAQGLPHPAYNSSAGKFYGDILMQLYKCQQGLCAYTEKYLCKSTHYAKTLWSEGRYASSLPAVDRHGSLDHFDPALKRDKAWLWDNFFVVDFETNSAAVKGQKKIDPILKPDSPSFEPFQLLDYNSKDHSFVAHPNLPDENMKERIENMLIILGVNRIAHLRRTYLRRLFHQIFSGTATWEDMANDIEQFPTAFLMCKMKVQSGIVDLEELLAI